MRVRGQHLVAKPRDAGQVDAVPVDRRRRVDAIKAAVESGAEIVNSATTNVITNAGAGSPNRLLYTGPATPAPAPTPDPD